MNSVAQPGVHFEWVFIYGQVFIAKYNQLLLDDIDASMIYVFFPRYALLVTLRSSYGY